MTSTIGRYIDCLPNDHFLHPTNKYQHGSFYDKTNNHSDLFAHSEMCTLYTNQNIIPQAESQCKCSLWENILVSVLCAHSECANKLEWLLFCYKKTRNYDYLLVRGYTKCLLGRWSRTAPCSESHKLSDRWRHNKNPCANKLEWLLSVSYTHLDVYKRQDEKSIPT